MSGRERTAKQINDFLMPRVTIAAKGKSLFRVVERIVTLQFCLDLLFT